MRVAIIAVASVAGIAASLLLAGCSAPRPLPPGPSAAEIDALVQVELDRQWAFTGLEGVVPRPVAEVEDIDSQNGMSAGLNLCMSEAGFTTWGSDDETGLNMSPDKPTADQELVYYECNARFPAIHSLSTEQLDYIYDYYSQWLIPCLAREGYSVVSPPSRRSFVFDTRMSWLWSPYNALSTYPTKQGEYDALTAVCAPTLPGIPGWSQEPS